MTATHDLDVAYVVRPGDRNEELRYSIRTVEKNLPHRDLVIAGHVPSWLDPTRVIGIHVPQTAHSKPLNALANLHAILNSSWLTYDVVLMNDDHFVTQHVTGIPDQSLGPMTWTTNPLFAGSRRYLRSMNDTLDILRDLGITEPWSYEGHTPFVANRGSLLAALALITRTAALHHGWPADRVAGILWRTVLGNLQGRPHPITAQAKVSSLEHPGPYPGPFLSTNDSTFARGAVGRWIRATWSTPSSYELDHQPATPGWSTP